MITPKPRKTTVRGFTCGTCGTEWKFQRCCPKCDRKSKRRLDPDKDKSFHDMGDGHYMRKAYLDYE